MKCIVVGGGIAGLIVANKLIDRGVAVTLLEASPRLGGRARSETLAGGIVNLGPHAIYNAGAARAILRSLGAEPVGGEPELSSLQMVFDGQVVPGLTSVGRIVQASYLNWSEKADAVRFFSRLLRIPTALDDVPFGEFVRSTTTSPPVAAFLRMSCSISTYAASDEVSTGAALRQIRRSLSGVTYVDGGWQSIVDRLAARATKRGVDVRTGTAVKDVAELDADRVVLAVPPGRVEALTGAQLGQRQPALMASLDLVLEPGVELSSTFDTDRMIYLSRHSGVATLGEGVVVHVGKYLGPTAHGDVRTELEAVLDIARPTWRAEVLDQRFLARVPVTHWLPRAVDGGESGRPGARLDDRTWIAGDWVGDEGMLVDAAAASALVTARGIAAEFGTHGRARAS